MCKAKFATGQRLFGLSCNLVQLKDLLNQTILITKCNLNTNFELFVLEMVKPVSLFTVFE